ncbi:MAG TPA: hypothetical protein VH144_03340 [Candidatus Saccharimonadales bacterium]|jgi:hypothetical protein|nr:hypothetical protein [Candidatus Saccharimonadales bacterium]
MSESITAAEYQVAPEQLPVPEIEREYTQARLARIALLNQPSGISISRPFSVNGSVGYEAESSISVSAAFSAEGGVYGYGPSQTERELEAFVRDPQNYGDQEAPASAIPINDGARESMSV